MSDKPIIFSAPMVRALLEGRKTQTRRVLKPQPEHLQVYDWEGKRVHDSEYRHWCWRGHVGADNWNDITGQLRPFLPVKVGDRLWVREAWSGAHAFRDVPPSKRESFATPDGPVLREDVWYWADGNPTGGDYEKPRTPIFIPRWASRVTLIVEDAKVERLQDISEVDALAEGVETERCCGVPSDSCGTHLGGCCGQPEAVEPVDAYRNLWNDINGDGAWQANPWVVAYTFRVIPQNIDTMTRNAA